MPKFHHAMERSDCRLAGSWLRGLSTQLASATLCRLLRIPGKPNVEWSMIASDRAIAIGFTGTEAATEDYFLNVWHGGADVPMRRYPEGSAPGLHAAS